MVCCLSSIETVAAGFSLFAVAETSRFLNPHILPTAFALPVSVAAKICNGLRHRFANIRIILGAELFAAVKAKLNAEVGENNSYYE